MRKQNAVIYIKLPELDCDRSEASSLTSSKAGRCLIEPTDWIRFRSA